MGSAVLNLKLVIDGSNKGAIAAIQQLAAESDKTGSSLSRLDLAAGNLDKTRGSVGALAGDMRGLQGSMLAFAAAAGVTVSLGGIVQLADAYANMSGRLKLATQYSNDYAEVQQLLVDSARNTRSDLQGTVDLYVKMAPALKGIGLNAGQAAGVITTINQAIGLSGASSQAASAALMQLGQGFGSGVLRGEELNSILEQTPALAMAIADGLGVPIGALRKLGEEGQLTAETVAGALQKMAPQLEADFARMPVTVGQALTGLRNEFLLFVGATDSATGGTSALASVIQSVTQEFIEAGPVVTAFSDGLKIMANGIDGAYRLLKILGLGLAGYAAAAKAALTGNFGEAKTILAEMGNDVQAVLEKPLITMRSIAATEADFAKKRGQLQAQLDAQIDKSAKLREYTETGVLDKIVGKEKEAITQRVAEQQRLVDAVRSAWQQSLQEAEKFAEQAKAKLTKATDIRAAGQTSAFNASISGMSPEEQAAAKSQRMADLQSQGSYEAARARLAAMEGDVKKYDTAAATAEKRLQEALKLAEDVKDVTAIEGISNELAKIQEAGAGMDQKKAAEAQQRAQDQAALLNDLQAKLDALTKEARTIEVKADVAAAESAIKGLQGQLAEMAKGTTIPVTVTTSGAGSAPPVLDLSSYGPGDPGIPGRAFGGSIPGFASHDRADNVVIRATPGEFMVQRPTVKQRGALAFLREFNLHGMSAVRDWNLRGYAFGGEIGGSAINRLSVPNISSAPAENSRQMYGNFILNDRSYEVSAPRSTFDDLTKHFQLEALKKGRRR